MATGSPPSTVLSGRYDFLLPHGLRLIGFASRLRRRLPGFVSAMSAPAAVQARRRAGVFVGHAGSPLSSVLARGQEQDLPSSLAIHPVTLRRSTTPDDPLRLADSGASGAAPTTLNNEGVIASPISRLTPPLRHLLSTLHDGRCRTPCKTRFRLAGCAFAGREVEPAGPRREVSVHVILLSRAYPGAINVSARMAVWRFSISPQ